MSRVSLTALLLGLASSVFAVGPLPQSPMSHGDRLRDGYFRARARQLADAALADIRTKADWEKARPELRRQFLDMMGLWPLPQRTDLKPTIVATTQTEHFTVHTLHFQSMPGLYVTGNLYIPRGKTGPFPAILYVCGHGPTVINGVIYGNKVTYQHHAAWFAEHGYVCLVLDTLQLGEVPGIHHGTSRFNMWWWASLGYTPAGIELWNGMRGVDYLVSRPEVDGKRLGVTGRSGGGATSWWVMAADERVGCAVPVAGIADLQAHVSEGYPGRLRDGVVGGHCDCMYIHNTYAWDYTQVMALCAPRPLLLGNSDKDDIFPVQGYRRMSDRVGKLYDLLGAKEKFGLLETQGPHKDTPALRLGAYRWMNRWLKDDNREVTEPERPRLDAKTLKVFDRLPGDAINDIVHERFRRPARLELPNAPAVAQAWWQEKAPQLKKALTERVFRGWPTEPTALAAKLAGTVTRHGVQMRAYDFTSETGIPLRVWLLRDEKVAKVGELVVSVADEAAWQEWVRDLGPDFAELLHGGGNAAPRPYPSWNKSRFEQLRKTLAGEKWAMALIAPRGVGPTRWSENSPFDGKPVGHQIRRRFLLLGQSLEGQQVWDVRRGVQALRSVEGYKSVPLTMESKREMAGVALYAAIYEPSVNALQLWHPPASHKKAVTLMNVLTVLDMPQAVALMSPRRVTLEVQDEKAWDWPVQLQRALRGESLRVRRSEE